MFGQSGSVGVLVLVVWRFWSDGLWGGVGVILGLKGSSGHLQPLPPLFCPGNQRNCSMQIAEEDIGTLGRSGPFHLGPILGDLIVLLNCQGL